MINLTLRGNEADINSPISGMVLTINRKQLLEDGTGKEMTEVMRGMRRRYEIRGASTLKVFWRRIKWDRIQSRECTKIRSLKLNC